MGFVGYVYFESDDFSLYQLSVVCTVDLTDLQL